MAHGNDGVYYCGTSPTATETDLTQMRMRESSRMNAPRVCGLCGVVVDAIQLIVRMLGTENSH